MLFPPTQHIAIARAPDDSLYNLDFYGENEGAAVVTGPKPEPNIGKVMPVAEVHREPASDPADARSKLAAWVEARGWVWIDFIAQRGAVT